MTLARLRTPQRSLGLPGPKTNSGERDYMYVIQVKQVSLFRNTSPDSNKMREMTFLVA